MDIKENPNQTKNGKEPNKENPKQPLYDKQEEKRKTARVLLILLLIVVIISMILGYELGKVIETGNDSAGSNNNTTKNTVLIETNTTQDSEENKTEEDQSEEYTSDGTYSSSGSTSSSSSSGSTSSGSSTSSDTSTSTSSGSSTTSNSSSSSSSGSSSSSDSDSSSNSSGDTSTLDEDETVYEIQIDETDLNKSIVNVATTTLQLFNYSSLYVVNGKIAPESSGSFNFYVTNKNSFDVKYQVTLSETNNANANIRYRLKIDDTYIEKSWITLSEIDQTYRTLSAQSKAHYSLEWKWVSASTDTEAGINPDNYTLTLKINATST